MRAVGRSQIGPSASHGHAQAILQRYGWNTMACQILAPGIEHWFAPGADAVVGYVAAGQTWVVAGAPVCRPDQLAETADQFAATAAHHGRRVCYFGAQERLATALAGHASHARLLIGAQPVWDPTRWPSIIAGKPSLRAQLARARNKGVTVGLWADDRAVAAPALRRCQAEWLEMRGLPPMRFVLTSHPLTELTDRHILIAYRDGAVVAYLVVTPIPQRNGWLIEQIVRGRAAPNGTVELLIDAAMHQLAAWDATYVTLGLAPLSAHAPDTAPPPPILIRALLAWMRAHAKRFYNFAGLDAFKAKLQPDHWEPVYVLSAERQISLRTLYAIGHAFGGTGLPAFIGRALVRAVAQEIHWARCAF